MPKSSTDVFLIHSLHDRGVASLVNAAIHSAGMTIFDDRTEYAPGTDWQRVFRKAINEAKCVVLLLTPNSVSSDHLLFEAGMAIGAGKPIFALHDGLRANQLPEFLQRYRVSGLEELPKVVAEIKSLASEPVTVKTA